MVAHSETIVDLRCDKENGQNAQGRRETTGKIL